MARQKIRVRQYQVAVNQAQQDALEKLMHDDMQENVSQYFGMLIAEVTNNRAENNRRPAGRPKKNDEPEDTNLYPSPYEGGAPYTKGELEAYYIMHKKPMPPLPRPLTAEEKKKYE